MLLDSFKTLKWTTAKKRTSSGYFIIGVKIKAEENLNVASFNNQQKFNLGHSSEKLNFNNKGFGGAARGSEIKNLSPISHHSELEPLNKVRDARLSGSPLVVDFLVPSN